MNHPDFKKPPARSKPPSRWAAVLMVFAALALLPAQGFGDDDTLTKYQVEAVFLYNFAKYVDWPANTFPNDTAPITIGVMGGDPFGDNLEHAVAGRSIKGRSFAIRHLTADSSLAGCQILFISASETARMGEILRKAEALPILTVGEDDSFAQQNGIISFVLKDGKVRLEIDLATARKAGLTISSRLLAVADLVKGRPN